MAFAAAKSLSDYNFPYTFKITPVDIQNYLSKVVLSDECTFRLSGSVNKINMRIWDTERPNESKQSFMNSPSVMVWCAVAKEKVTGTYFFEDENVNGEKYRNMLIHYAFTSFASLKGDYIFHQYGAPRHYSTRVRTYLNHNRPNNWIGRGGPVERSPRSPDLTPYDFFVGTHKRNGVQYSCYNHRTSDDPNSKGLQGNPTRCLKESVG